MDSFVTCKTSNLIEAESDSLKDNSMFSEDIFSHDKIDAISANDGISHHSDSGLSLGNSTETDRDSYSASSQETVTSLESFPSDRSISLTLHSHNAESECEQTRTCVSQNELKHLPPYVEILCGENSVCDSRTHTCSNGINCRTKCADNLTSNAGDDDTCNRTCSNGTSEKNKNEKFYADVHVTDKTLESSVDQQTLKHTRLKIEEISPTGFKTHLEESEECSIVLHEIVSYIQCPKTDA